MSASANVLVTATEEIAVADVAPASSRDALFRNGTLVYTGGAVALLFFWLLLGDFAIMMRERSVTPTVQLFLRSLNASNFTISLLLTFVPPAISLFVTPVISYRSDRTRTRWGRRIPYLIVTTPLAALGMVVIAFSPQVASLFAGPRLSADHATLAVFTVAWTVFEVAALASVALFGALINDVVPRGRLGRFFAMFRMVGLVDGILFNAVLLQFAESHFELMFCAIAAVFGGGFLLMCLMVREGQYPPPDATALPTSRAGAVGTFLRECFGLRYYRCFYLAFTLGFVTFLPVNTFSLLYAKQLNMDLGLYGRLIALGYGVSIVSAYPLGWLVDRFHSLRVTMIALVSYVASMIYAVAFVHDQRTFVIALVAHTVLSGIYWTSTAPLLMLLLPRSRFAQFASACGILTAAATMVVGPSVGALIDAVGGNYRVTFYAGLVLSLSAVAGYAIVYRKFMSLGGPAGYVAPGDAPSAGPRGFEVVRH